MQYDVNTPEEYLRVLEDDWRKNTLLEVRSMLFKNAPDIEEGISYKMLSYRLDDKDVFALNAQKHYVSFYVGTIDKIPNSDEWLKDFNTGKGCVRIKKSNNLDDLERFIEAAVELERAGGDTGC